MIVYNGIHQWTLSSLRGFNKNNFFISSNGLLNSNLTSSSYNIRPTIFLNTNIILEQGNGSKSNPFLLKN